MPYTLRAAAAITTIPAVQSSITKRHHRRAVRTAKPPRRPTTCCGKLRCTCPGTAIDPRESGWWKLTCKLVHDERVWDGGSSSTTSAFGTHNQSSGPCTASGAGKHDAATQRTSPLSLVSLDTARLRCESLLARVIATGGVRFRVSRSWRSARLSLRPVRWCEQNSSGICRLP
jgi:hypothetical protein